VDGNVPVVRCNRQAHLVTVAEVEILLPELIQGSRKSNVDRRSLRPNMIWKCVAFSLMVIQFITYEGDQEILSNKHIVNSNNKVHPAEAYFLK
jgi:hypothetical protein